jgi:hypothetical protein
MVGIWGFGVGVRVGFGLGVGLGFGFDFGLGFGLDFPFLLVPLPLSVLDRFS